MHEARRGEAPADEAGLERFLSYMKLFADNGRSPRMTIYPGLTARPWHEPSRFAIARALESAFPAIKAEILSIDGDEFQNQAEKISRTGAWDVFFFYELGLKNEGNCRRCPVITKLIEDHATIRSLAGLIYVSRLKPGTHIALHRGPTNMRLRCHLAITVPRGDAGIRVGGETRRWVAGECLVFDDRFEHEAWNKADAERLVLVVDFWHPDLTPIEIALLEGLHRFGHAYHGHLTRYWQRNEESRSALR